MKLASKIFRRNDWYVTSKYGYRNPIKTSAGITQSFHNGTDYGTNVQKWAQYAIEAGKVLSCGKDTDGALFVWVEYPRINKKLLHYHLDSLKVKAGQAVVEGTLLGYTGTTGKSTGIHLHLGVKDSVTGKFEDPHAYNYVEYVAPTKSVEEVANEVIQGLWGNGENRKARLTNAGYNYSEVQGRVNEILAPKPAPEIDMLDLVRKTIRGDFGNGVTRKQNLGSNYAEVQRQVNLNVQHGLTRWDNIKLF